MTPPSRWIFFPSATGSNWSDYMAANAGVGYWIIPAGTAETAQVSGPTGGASSTTFTKVRALAAAGEGTTQGGVSISGTDTEWKRGLQGSHNSLSGPYRYAPIGWQAAGSTAFGQAHGAGWVVCEREQTPGGITSTRQSYLPIEGTDGLTETTWSGGMPKWSASGYDDHIVFFISTYTSGDLATWTTWDGTTTP